MQEWLVSGGSGGPAAARGLSMGERPFCGRGCGALEETMENMGEQWIRWIDHQKI